MHTTNSIKQTRNVRQIVQGTPIVDRDASTILALQSIQAQLNALRDSVTQAQANAGTSYDSEMNQVQFGNMRTTLLSLANAMSRATYKGEVVKLANGGNEKFSVLRGLCDEGAIGVIYTDATYRMSGADPVFVSAAAQPGSTCAIAVNGLANIRVNATSHNITVGDTLIPDSLSGYARRGVPGQVGAFATALEHASVTDGKTDILANINPDIKKHNFEFDVNQPYTMIAAYDTDGTVTGASGNLLSATWFREPAMNTKIQHTALRYQSGRVISCIRSMYAVNGAAMNTLTQSFEYQNERISKIIQELEG